MSRKCGIVAGKGVVSGNNVSHSNRKTRRKFRPNMQLFSLMSEALGRFVTIRATPSSIRTIEHNDGLDKYLSSTSNKELTLEALSLKKKIVKALAKTSINV